MARVTLEEARQISRKMEDERFKELINLLGKEEAIRLEQDEFYKLQEKIEQEALSIRSEIGDISDEDYIEFRDKWLKKERNSLKLKKIIQIVADYGVLRVFPSLDNINVLKKVFDILIK